ncbi:hypothetical protein ALC57_07596 [Trachymyrmex cornetzi]|uniref:DUF4806 domain-containing protein n=1 Tax=Trachymyrmex cornetzi TaxID=471704 RepID=A0A151J7R9_9HYME|nr:hypothetical protein ALC57_07596 [Trachymyrmex cornetzi]
MNNKLDQIDRAVQKNKNRHRIQQKPILLPICTEVDMISFENVDEESYEEVVDYFLHAGGFTAKEAVNLSFKEVIQDHLTTEFTWFGREEGLHPLYNTRIKAIYGV